MKFLEHYDNFAHCMNFNFPTDISILEGIEEINERGKFGTWLFDAPKIRNMQWKANDIRYEAAHMETDQKKRYDEAVKAGKNPDKAAMWKILQQKLDAMEDNAREYEAEAITLAGGNEYLRKVQRITRLKGAVRVNNERIALAEAAERAELQKQNREYEKIIREETAEVNDKIKEDTQKEKESVKKEKDVRDHEIYLASQRAHEKRKKGEVMGKGGREYPNETRFKRPGSLSN